MIRFIHRLICGYIKVCFFGKDVRRCLNLCVRQDIEIWDVQSPKDDTFVFYLYRSDLYRCKLFLKKTHTKVQVLERYGLPFFSFRYRKRKLFPIAFVVISILVIYYSQFIWKIEVIGNSYLSEDTIIAYLQEKGAGFGDKKNALDCAGLELDLRTDFGQVIWASAYIEGTKLVVELQENIHQGTPAGTFLQNQESDICYDLAASKDAVISSIITRTGIPCVKEGQEVKEGDVLVSGRQEIRNDSDEVADYFYQTADADIKGIVIYHYEDSIPMEYEKEVENGNVRNKFCLQWKDWMIETPSLFPAYEHAHVLEDCTQIHLTKNFYLPLYVGKKEYREYEIVTVENQESDAKQIAQTHLDQYLDKLAENGVQIISKNVIMNRGTSDYQISGEIKACESIGKQVETERKEIQQEGTTIDEHE